MSSLRAVVIGAGAGIFKSHRAGLKEIGAEVVGVQDVNLERARPVGAELGCPVYEDVSSLLAQPADLAVIVAPHPFHAELALAAFAAGKHVLVEKPIAVQVAEADRMVAEAERRELLLAVAFQRRALREIREARRLVSSGALGVIQRADVIGVWPRRIGYFQMAPWRGTWRGEGGGVLLNQGQHDLDLLFHVVGAFPKRVAGWVRTRLHAIETEDSVQAMLEWEGGALGSVHISTAEADEGRRIEVVGTGGRLRVLGSRLEVTLNEEDFREHAVSGGDPFANPATHETQVIQGGGGSHIDLYRNLARALAGLEPPLADGRSATAVLEVANAIILSSRTCTEIDLPLDRAAYARLLESVTT